MTDNKKHGADGSTVLAIIGWVIIIAFVLWMMNSCSSTPRRGNSYSDSASSDALAAEEASHYHYDSNGHIFDDRD